MSSGSISKAARPRNGRVRACNHCRQFKIRCDSAELFPAPCSACKAKGRDCSVDSNFKPIRTRSLLRDVTTQLTQIQETLQRRGHDIAIPRPASVASQYGTHIEPPDASLEPQQLESGPPSAVPSTVSSSGLSTGCKDDMTFICGQKLGDVPLEPEALRGLFEHFRRNHYLYFPILDRDFCPTELAQSCPLLFWTIIVISSRHHSQYSSIYPSLVAPYKTILSNALVRPIDSVRVIQAILYICLWPLPIHGQNGDPSFTYCGMAVNASLRLGLHDPSMQNESRIQRRFYVGDREERVRTWRGCIYLSTQ
ncbi:hypothetical protein V1509DRAFT_654457 [Lipomyces kononenkoae]